MTTSTTLEPTTTNEGFPERFIQVCPSDNFTLFLQASGDAWSCGDNSRGQLGNNTNNQTSTPAIFASGFIKLDVGSHHSGGLDSKGTLYLWGDGWHGELGIDPNTISDDVSQRYIKQPLERAYDVLDFALGDARSFYLNEEGLISACGENTDGILGVTSGETHVRGFELVQTPEGVVFVSINAGMDHFGAIDSSGALWMWGSNEFSKLGVGGSSEGVYPPTKVISLNVRSVSCGQDFTLVTLTNGRVLAVGKGGWGQVSLWFDVIGEPSRNYSLTEVWGSYDEEFARDMSIIYAGDNEIMLFLQSFYALKFVPWTPSGFRETKLGRIYLRYVAPFSGGENDQPIVYSRSDFQYMDVTFQETGFELYEPKDFTLHGWGSDGDDAIVLSYEVNQLTTTTSDPNQTSTTEEPTTSTSTTDQPTTSSTTLEPTTSTSTTIDPSTLDSDSDGVNDAEDYFYQDSRISVTETELQTWVSDPDTPLDNNSTDPIVIRALRTFDNTLELGKFYLFYRDDYGVIEMTDQAGNSDGSLSADLSARGEGWEVIKPFVATTTSSTTTSSTTTEEPTTSTSTTTGEPTTTQDPNREAVAGDTIISTSDQAYMNSSITNYGGSWSGNGTIYNFPIGATAEIIEILQPESSGYPMYKVNYNGSIRYISEALRFQYGWLELLPSEPTTTSSTTTGEPTTSTSTTEEPTTSSTTTEEPTTSTTSTSTTSTSTTSTSTTTLEPLPYTLIGSSGENTGRNLEFNADGSTLAVGSDTSIRVYSVYQNELTQLGGDITRADSLQVSLALTDDGTTLVVGEGLLNQVSVYRFNGTTWSPESVPNPPENGSSIHRFGWDVDINSNGEVLIASDPFRDAGDDWSSGSVYVYFYDGVTWELTSSIEPTDLNFGSYFGYSISIDSNGSNFVAGAYGYGEYIGYRNTGQVRHYSIDSSLNTYLEATLISSIGYDVGDRFGKIVSISSDGQIFAVGSESASPISNSEGRVEVFENISGTWTLKGQAVDGIQRREGLGTDVALSGDGLTFITGSDGFDLEDASTIYGAGKAEIYSFENGSWVQVEQITGTEDSEDLGNFVAISRDGSISVVSSPRYGDEQGAISLISIDQPTTTRRLIVDPETTPPPIEEWEGHVTEHVVIIDTWWDFPTQLDTDPENGCFIPYGSYALPPWEVMEILQISEDPCGETYYMVETTWAGEARAIYLSSNSIGTRWLPVIYRSD